jgi:hypothetical protein
MSLFDAANSPAMATRSAIIAASPTTSSPGTRFDAASPASRATRPEVRIFRKAARIDLRAMARRI